MIRKRWAVVALGAAIAFVLGGGTTLVLAGGTAITAQANSLAVIKTVAIGGPVSTSSTSFVDMPGVARTATSTGTGNLFVAEFFAESHCFSTGGVTECDIRIAVKDSAGTIVDFMNPDLKTQFDASGDGDESHAIQRSISGLAPGTYTFQVQFKTDNDPGGFSVQDVHFTLERYT